MLGCPRWLLGSPLNVTLSYTKIVTLSHHIRYCYVLLLNTISHKASSAEHAYSHISMDGTETHSILPERLPELQRGLQCKSTRRHWQIQVMHITCFIGSDRSVTAELIEHLCIFLLVVQASRMHTLKRKRTLLSFNVQRLPRSYLETTTKPQIEFRHL